MQHSMDKKGRICWTITDDFPGMKSQVLGLSEAIGIPTKHKTCKSKWPISLPWSNPLNQLTEDSDPLSPPWPDLVITCGRRSAPLSLAIKRNNKGRTLSVHIQDPLSNRNQFDLIISPKHDNLKGANVMQTRGALHKITPEKLTDGIKEFGHLFKDYPGPYSSVLIGGTTNRYNMTKDAVEDIIQKIADIQQITYGSVFVTPSFRTPYREVFNEKLTTLPQVFLADIERINPYFAMLGMADYLFVTDDSVNMVCEACYTGKPVYILPLLNHSGTKPIRFVNELVKDGIVRHFDGQVDEWTYSPINDTAKAADTVRKMLGLRKG